MRWLTLLTVLVSMVSNIDVARAECIKDRKAGEVVAKLYPTGKLGKFSTVRGKPGMCLQVSPIQREGKWGYVDRAFTLAIEGGYTLVAFGFLLAADSADGVDAIRTFDHLEDEPIEARQGMQVILLDSRGKFVDKPMLFPVLKSTTIGCLGDMCSTMGVRLDGLKRVPGSNRAAYIEYQARGLHNVMAFLWAGGDLHSSRSEGLGYLDDLSGCDRGTRLQRIAFEKNQIVATLLDQCNVEACPEECKSELGLTPQRPKAVPRQVTLVGSP